MDGVLVVGGSGRVGRMLLRAWAEKNQRPIGQSRGVVLHPKLPHLLWQPLEGPDALAKWCGQNTIPRAMLLLAGIVPGRGDMSQSDALAETCLQAAAHVGIPKVLVTSSSSVYGAQTNCREISATQPVNDYGRAKLRVEKIAARHGATALRIGNVAGADALLLNAANGGPVVVDQFADGLGPLRSYIGIGCLARILPQLLTMDLPPIVNIAAPAAVSMADLAQASGVKWGWRAAPPNAHQYITLDCGLLQDYLAFSKDDNSPETMVADWQCYRDPVAPFSV